MKFHLVKSYEEDAFKQSYFTCFHKEKAEFLFIKTNRYMFLQLFHFLRREFKYFFEDRG